MKTLLRTLLYLALIVWLGGEIFFPIVAAITFGTLQPDTHTAGRLWGTAAHSARHGAGLGVVGVVLAGAGSSFGRLQATRGAAPMGW